MAIRPLVSSPLLITLLNNPGWVFTGKASYLNVFLMLLSGASFVHYIYPTTFSKITRVISAWIFVIMTFIIFFTPLLYISYSDPVITVTVSYHSRLCFIYEFQGSTKKEMDRLCIFCCNADYGIWKRSPTCCLPMEDCRINKHTLSHSLCFSLLSSRRSLLIREWVNTYKEKEKLNNQLEDLTKHLEERVFNRTRELNIKTAEIENQHRLIVEQNARLSDTIRIKNKIFSVISHDLRGPIVNIQYVLNLIKEEEFRDQTEPLTNSCIKYSQMVISLLENMLVWGRGQEDMIRYSPSEYDLADTILTNLSIYKESADQKEISLNFTQKGKSKGWFDKDLIDIIIRNLISNAIKFTNRGGRVSIVLNESDEPAEGLIFKICDNGVGIPPEQLKDIFSGEDVQSTNGTESEKGTGLGLKLVYELVTLSHGTISVESSPGIGSSFTITLPGKNDTNNVSLSKVTEVSS